MKQFLLGALATLGLGAVAVAGLLHVGAIDAAADSPHGPLLHRIIAWARERAILRAAADLIPPPDLSDAERIRRGAGNYDAMCVNCHLSPGAKDTEIRQGLYPAPPNLANPSEVADADRADARRFWIIKHGIKASGMPAWSKGGMEDGAIWDLTAFLRVLPRLSPKEYRGQVGASDGHAHGGIDGHRSEADAKPATSRQNGANPHAHKHGEHRH